MTTPHAASTVSAARLDVVFYSPLLFIPTVEQGNVTSIEVLAPKNGHPIGAVFLPATFFSDADLNQPDRESWMESSSYSLLDPHSYALEITQTGTHLPFPAAAIPDANHKVRPGRRLSGDWDAAFTLYGHLSRWDSLRQSPVKEGHYHGSDAPKGEFISSLHRLTYSNVTTAEFCGAHIEQKEYLSANINKGGTLIIVGEIPYQPSLLHERQAIDSIARLAG